MTPYLSDKPFQEKGYISQAEYISVSTRLLAKLFYHHKDSPPDEESRKAIARMRKHFNDNPVERRTPVERIIQELKFKHDIGEPELFGRALSKHLTDIRVEGYMRCLAETNLTLKQIATAFNRSDASAVTRVLETRGLGWAVERQYRNMATNPLPEAG